MAAFSFLKWFRNISIAKKLYFAVGIMALLIAIELFTLWFAINTLSSVRAFVGGEGLWSKGQKDAVYHLQKYGYTHQEADYQKFLTAMKVPLGDHKTRLELIKLNPEWRTARQGFIEGGNHPDDINGMINLFRRFHNISYINRAIILWSEADSVITPFMAFGAQLHDEINSPNPSQSKIDGLLNQIEASNETLTSLENEFSYTLGEGSRWLENIILKLLFAVALTVEISGLLLTISVSRSIQKGLNEIIRVSKKIGKGDFSEKARAFSGDEIGILANSFNQMSEELGQANESLKNYAHQLEQSNHSLEQFAFIASHDLQEPLRKINTFSSRLEDEYKGVIDERGKTYLDKIISSSTRMQQLIRDILNFSKLNSDKFTFEKTDLNIILKQVLSDMEVTIEKNNARIITTPLPVVDANAGQVGQLFQNIISNSLKFKKNGSSPEIEINNDTIYGSELNHGNNIKSQYKKSMWGYKPAWEKEKFCKISIKDNGIGFDTSYADRIFEVFQRLNSSSNYEGTGIGLAICKKITDNHHGIITTESRPGSGATFTVILPFSQANFNQL